VVAVPTLSLIVMLCLLLGHYPYGPLDVIVHGFRSPGITFEMDLTWAGMLLIPWLSTSLGSVVTIA
jgi:hypothetical protein